MDTARLLCNKKYININLYTSTLTLFFMCSKPTKRNKITHILTNLTQCRESLVFYTEVKMASQFGFAKVMKIKKDEYINFIKLKRKIDTKNIYVGVKSVPYYGTAGRAIKTAITLLNIFERKYGWELSEIYKLSTDLYKNKDFFLFKGCDKWIKSPFAISLYTLLIRTGEIEEIQKIILSSALDNEKLDNMYKFINGLTKSDLINMNVLKSRTLYRIIETYDIWEPFIKHYDGIFKNKSIKRNYGPERYGKLKENQRSMYDIEEEGITSLSIGDILDTDLLKSYSKYIPLK